MYHRQFMIELIRYSKTVQIDEDFADFLVFNMDHIDSGGCGFLENNFQILPSGLGFTDELSDIDSIAENLGF